MEQLKDILIIEDDIGERWRSQRWLEGYANVFFAWNLKTAKEMLKSWVWDIIAFDLFLAYEEEDDIPKDTIDLIMETKKSWFKGTMIAASNEEQYRDEQISAGCTLK